MPIVSIDWPQMKSLVGGDTVLVAMTDRQLAMINSLAIQLRWRKTWRIDGYDFADWDDLLQEIDDLGVNLNMPVYLTDLIASLAAIRQAVESIQTLTDPCCTDFDPTGGAQYIEPFTEDQAGDVPQNLVDAGLATDTSDWDGFYAYLCAIAHVYVDDYKRMVDEFADHFDEAQNVIIGVGALASLAAAVIGVLTGGAALVVLGIAGKVALGAGIFAALTEIGQDGLPTAASVEAARKDLVCAFIDGALDGFDQRLAAFKSEANTKWPLAIPLNEILIDDWRWRPLYQASYADRNIAQEMVSQGFDPANYSCATCDESFDPNNWLLDGGFEYTTVPGPIWKHGPYAEGQRLGEAKKNGSYGWKGSKGAGWPDEYYTYQEFEIDVSGNMSFKYWSKHYQGSYNSIFRVEKWNGSSWQQVGSTNYLMPPWDGQWHEMHDQSAGAQTPGLYRVRIGLGYNYFDDVRCLINLQGPGE